MSATPLSAFTSLADKLGGFSDEDLDSCFDDVALALTSSRLLSVAELDSLTDAVAAVAASTDARRATMEGQLRMLLDRVRANPHDDRLREPPSSGSTNADIGIPQMGLTG